MSDETIEVQLPVVGSTVHYVSYGTPGGEYGKCCRAAYVTAVGAWTEKEIIDAGHDTRLVKQVWDPLAVGLCVLNPTGQFFNQVVTCCTGEPVEEKTELCAGVDYCGGSWHHIVVPGVTDGDSR